MLFRDMKLTTRKISKENGLISLPACQKRGASWRVGGRGVGAGR